MGICLDGLVDLLNAIALIPIVTQALTLDLTHRNHRLSMYVRKETMNDEKLNKDDYEMDEQLGANVKTPKDMP